MNLLHSKDREDYEKRTVVGLLKVWARAEEVCDCCSSEQLVLEDECLCLASCSSLSTDTGLDSTSLRTATTHIAIALSEVDTSIEAV